MLQEGIIVPNSSPFSSPIVKKKVAHEDFLLIIEL